MSRTHKMRVCAGCKVEQQLPEATLCKTCSDELANLRRYAPLVPQLMARKTTRSYIGERCFVPTNVKYISGQDDEDNGTPTATWFATTMADFLKAFCLWAPVDEKDQEFCPSVMFRHSDSGGRYLNYKRDTYPKVRLEMTEEQRTSICELFRALNMLLAETKRDGQEHGQDLLGQLAAGEVTAERFEQHLDDIAQSNREGDAVAHRHMK